MKKSEKPNQTTQHTLFVFRPTNTRCDKQKKKESKKVERDKKDL